MRFKIAAIQMVCRLGEPASNLAKAEGFLRRAAHAGAKMVCLPELFDSGYDLKWVKAHAAEQFPKTRVALSRLASGLGIHIIAGVANVRRGNIYNSAHVFSPEGRIMGRYDKMHPFPLTHEDRYFEKGMRVWAVKTQYCPIGMGICFDLRFGDLFSRQAHQGARIFFVPSAWGIARLHHWLVLLRARAVENQVYVVAAGQVGTPGPITFAGHSAIIDFDGTVCAEKREGEGVIVANVDIARLAEWRRALPMS